MKTTLLILMAVVVVGCGTTSWVSDPSNENNVKIEAAIRERLSKPTGELTKADLEKVTELDLKQNQLTDVKGLENLTQLQNLHLDWNKLTNEDLKPLTGLTNLRWLGLGGIPPLGDLTPLGELTKLEQLQLAYDRLTNISSLARLKELKGMDLSATSLTDEQLKHLSGLTKLTALDLRQNRLTDVSALARLTQLAHLTLNDNQLTDVSPLAELKELESLTLHKNKITDISPLMRLKQLERLNLKDNPALTKAQIDQLQKALPKCEIFSNPKNVVSLLSRRDGLVYLKGDTQPYTGVHAQPLNVNGGKIVAGYKNGRFHGNMEEWYNTRQRFSKSEWDNGKLLNGTTWRPDGTVGSRVINGNGSMIRFSPKGFQIRETHYRNGVRVPLNQK